MSMAAAAGNGDETYTRVTGDIVKHYGYDGDIQVTTAVIRGAQVYRLYRENVMAIRNWYHGQRGRKPRRLPLLEGLVEPIVALSDAPAAQSYRLYYDKKIVVNSQNYLVAAWMAVLPQALFDLVVKKALGHRYAAFIAPITSIRKALRSSANQQGRKARTAKPSRKRRIDAAGQGAPPAKRTRVAATDPGPTTMSLFAGGGSLTLVIPAVPPATLSPPLKKSVAQMKMQGLRVTAKTILFSTCVVGEPQPVTVRSLACAT